MHNTEGPEKCYVFKYVYVIVT